MSDEIKDGGPAFPLQSIGPDFVPGYAGMTLRDWFAGQAISGACCPAPDGWSLPPQDHAAWAYEIADAMIAARETGGAA